MDAQLIEQINNHTVLCQKILLRHMQELIGFYQDEIEPIKALVKDQSDYKMRSFIECIEEIASNQEED